MNRERAKELAPIIAAYGEGKTIQYKDKRSPPGETPKWGDCSVPQWNYFRDYKIKPEPQKFWVIFGPQGTPLHVRSYKPDMNSFTDDCVVEEYTRHDTD